MAEQLHEQAIAQVLQDANGRILGYLVRICGNFDDAEDIRQDVMVAALDHWRAGELPDNPLAYLLKMARNRAADKYRTSRTHQRIHDFLTEDTAGTTDLDEKLLEDDLLRLIFTCCHPALSQEIRVPLTLKAVTGLNIEEVARAFLVTPKTMEQRLLRAKKKIQQAGIAYEVPQGRQLEPRLDSVMQTLYLLFNEGYAATSGTLLIREDLCREAIRLATIMQRLFPARAELIALLSLMLFQDSRRQTRVSATGDLILLEDQDRSRWNHRAIQQASALLHKALHLRQKPGAYQLQASIAALHAEAANASETDWQQIAMLYGKLLALSYTEVIHLNFAVALSQAGNPDLAMRELAVIAPALNSYFPFFCVRADCHTRLAEPAKAVKDYKIALTLTNNDAERRFIESRLNT